MFGNNQHSAWFALWDFGYNVVRGLNERLSNRVVEALARPTVATQESSTPFPFTGTQRYYGRSISQGLYFSPRPVHSQTPTNDWGEY